MKERLQEMVNEIIDEMNSSKGESFLMYNDFVYLLNEGMSELSEQQLKSFEELKRYFRKELM